MTGLKARYKKYFKTDFYLKSLLAGIVLLVVSLVINIFAGMYATHTAGSAVGDIFLSNIPALNVDDFFVYGPIIFWLIVIVLSLKEPKTFPMMLKTIALFALIRSIFITLTHIGPFPDHIPVDSFSLTENIDFFIFNSGADLFFSGHTGLPFLLALLFWDHPKLRIFCLASAVFFGFVVLLGHLHYSIDVLSAFFITYTIYHIALRIFPEDYKLFLEESH